MGAAPPALGALQRFAATGLPDRLAFPELVNLLNELVPFETAAMLWLGPDHLPIDTYTNMDMLPDFVTRYVERWYDAEEGRFYPRQLQMQLDPDYHVIRVSDFTPEFGETEVYDEIYKPARHHWIAGLALRDARGPIGNLGIGRDPRSPDFSDEEMRLLARARPHVVQALARTGEIDAWPDLDVEDEVQMLIVDIDGAIVHATPGAWRLVHAAVGAPADPNLLRDRVYADAQPILAELARRVAANYEGATSAPARKETVTSYGRFLLRAYAFDTPREQAPRTFGIQIEKRLPLALKMFRSATFRALTAREQDIARLLATGLSYPRIADMLDLGPSTVVTHVRRLGQKLDVATREDIVRALCN